MQNHEQYLLRRLIDRRPEDNFVERKPQSVKPQELRQTLVAFANSVAEGQTAVLFIGVDDRTGSIIGVDDVDSLQKRVGDAGRECYPPIQPGMIALYSEAKCVLAVEVAFSKEKPHFAGPAYIRSGSRSVKAPESLYRDILTSHCSKAGELLRWKGKDVTVKTINKRLGNHHQDFEPGLRLNGTARVIAVDPFSVTFDFTTYSAERCVEPLSRIELDWDGDNSRRMVIVRGVSA